MIPSKIAVLCLVGFVLLVNFIEARPASGDDSEAGHHGHVHVHKKAHPEQHQHHNHSQHHHVQANGDDNSNPHVHHHHYRVGGDHKPHVHHHHYRVGGDDKPHVHHHNYRMDGDHKPHVHHHHFQVGGKDKPEKHHFQLGGSESKNGNFHIHRYALGNDGGNVKLDGKLNLDDLFRGFSPETIRKFKKILKDLNIDISQIGEGGHGPKPNGGKGGDNGPDDGDDSSPNHGNGNKPADGNNNNPNDGSNNNPNDGSNNSPNNGGDNNGKGSPGLGGGGIHKYDGKDSLQPTKYRPVCDDSINDRYGVGKHFVRGARDVGYAILSEAELLLDPIFNGLTHGLGEGLKVALCAIENGFSDFGSDFDSATDIAKHGLVNFFKLQGPHPVLGIPVGIGGIIGEAGKAIASIGGDAAQGIRDGLDQLTHN